MGEATEAAGADPLYGLDHSDFPYRSWWDRVGDALRGLDSTALRDALAACDADRIAGDYPPHTHDLSWAIRDRLRKLKG